MRVELRVLAPRALAWEGKNLEKWRIGIRIFDRFLAGFVRRVDPGNFTSHSTNSLLLEWVTKLKQVGKI